MECPNCKKIILETQEYCPSCGLELKKGDTSPELRKRTSMITVLSLFNYFMFVAIFGFSAYLFIVSGPIGPSISHGWPFFIVAAIFLFAAHGLWNLRSYGRKIQIVMSYCFPVVLSLGTLKELSQDTLDYLVLTPLLLGGIPLCTLWILALNHLKKPEIYALFSDSKQKSKDVPPLRCKVCGKEYPSRFWFKAEGICVDCYDKGRQD